MKLEEKQMRPFKNAGVELITGFILAVILLGTFAKLSRDILHHEIEHFDTVVGEFIRGFRSEWLTDILIFVTNLGDTYAYIVVVLVLLFVLLKYLKQYLHSIFLLIAVLGSWGLNEFLKATFHRARPEIAHLVEQDGYSFPSGHAMVSVATYGIIAYIVWSNKKEKSRIAWIALAVISFLILIIGVSRVYLGVHFPSDVIAGYAAGGVWLVACIYGLKGIRFYQWKKGERINNEKTISSN